MVTTGSPGPYLDGVETIRITEARNEVKVETCVKGVQVHHGENNGFIEIHLN